MTTGLRRAAGVFYVLVALAMLGLASAATAAAHPTLLFTDPAADTAVPVAPQAITLMFNEPVTIGPDAIVVLDKDGHTVPTGVATTARGGQLYRALARHRHRRRSGGGRIPVRRRLRADRRGAWCQRRVDRVVVRGAALAAVRGVCDRVRRPDRATVYRHRAR